MSSFGAYLRDLRERQGVSLDELSRATRVLHHYLEALEADDLTALPAPVFTKGFIRACCQVFGVAPDEALALYDQRIAKDLAGVRITPAPPPPRDDHVAVPGSERKEGRGRGAIRAFRCHPGAPVGPRDGQRTSHRGRDSSAGGPSASARTSTTSRECGRPGARDAAARAAVTERPAARRAPAERDLARRGSVRPCAFTSGPRWTRLVVSAGRADDRTDLDERADRRREDQ